MKFNMKLTLNWLPINFQLLFFFMKSIEGQLPLDK